MKLPKGMKVIISGITHRGEVPDQLVNDELKAKIDLLIKEMAEDAKEAASRTAKWEEVKKAKIEEAKKAKAEAVKKAVEDQKPAKAKSDEKLVAPRVIKP